MRSKIQLSGGWGIVVKGKGNTMFPKSLKSRSSER